jgi:hypothetical protein
MSTPEEKQRKRMRIRSHIAKDLLTPKYGQRVVEDKRKKARDVTKLTHAELVALIQEENNDDS